MERILIGIGLLLLLFGAFWLGVIFYSAGYYLIFGQETTNTQGIVAGILTAVAGAGLLVRKFQKRNSDT